MMKNKKGASMLDGILAFLVLVIVSTAVLIPQVKNASQTGWTAAEVALYSLITIFIIVGIIRFAGSFGGN